MLNCLDESPGTKSTILVSVADLNFNTGLASHSRLKNLQDKPCSQKPSYLLTNSLTPFFVETAEKLSDRFKLRINIKCVLSKFPRYTWHVRRLPCKDVPVLMDELDERAFLFGIQVSADAELLG